MSYCDPHGWGWEPGQGPSPCMAETLSFLLAVGIFVTSILSKDSMRPVQRAAAAGSLAARVHSAQITLSLVQAVIALTGGFLSARPRGMLCGALVLHSLGWTFAWLASAAAMQRNPAYCKRLFWWWLAGAVSNRCVYHALAHACLLVCAVCVYEMSAGGWVISAFAAQPWIKTAGSKRASSNCLRRTMSPLL